MKRIASAAFLVCLLGGTSALAQHQNDGSSGPPSRDAGTRHPHTVTPNDGAHPFTGHATGAPTTVTPQVHTVTSPPPVTTQTYTGRNWNPNAGHNNNNNNNDNGRNWRYNDDNPTWQHNNNPNWQHNGPLNFGAPGFHPGGQRPRFNPQFFPRHVNPGARFHWRSGRWFGPPGFYYRPWFYGQVLPYGWYSSQWYIEDYWDYGLPVPPYGYEWIRNGPDALLVDISRGTVVEVVQGIFY